MMKRILLLIGAWLCLTVTMVAANKKFTLVIDAGHGGHDTGAAGVYSKEKMLTLRYALAFGRIVERNCPDVKVIYTRKTDHFLELWQRADIANSNKADLFVSVHINALPKGRIARGYQTYTLGRSLRNGNTRGYIENLEVAKRENSVIFYEKDYQQHYEGFDPNSPESNIMFEFIQDKNMENSVRLAKLMQRYICSATGRQDKGVHQDNLAVLRKASMPACLLELGFISTPDEERFLNSDAALQQYAQGFYNAFVAYKNKVSSSVAVPYEAPKEAEVNIPSVVPQDIRDNNKEDKKARKAAEKERKRKEKEEREREQAEAQRQQAQARQSVPAADSVAAAQPKDTAVAAPVALLTPAVAESPSAPAKTTASPQPVIQPLAQPVAAAPVFKVQILASGSRLPKKSPQLKGQQADCYQEGGMYKYTVGASSDYNEIVRLRKTLTDRFPEAFIIAFKNGKKTDVREAIREFREAKGRK